ncbi:MAG: SDR family NAD(P)-dependent oxidoreductase [Saprospiraceae bacterium]
MKTILITHADNEFGKSVTVSCLERGFNMLIVGQQKETLYDLDEMVKEIGGASIALVADLKDSSQAQKLAAIADVNFGRFDIIFHLPPTEMPFDKQALWSASSNHLAELIPLCEILNRKGGGTIVYFSIDTNAGHPLFQAVEKNISNSVSNLKLAYPTVNFVRLKMNATSTAMNKSLNNDLMDAIFYVLEAPKMLKIDKFALDF